MKKLLLLTVLFLTSITISAQDASNDATWEETISFLKNNIKYVAEARSRKVKNCFIRDNILNVKINEESGEFKDDEYLITLPLDKIINASLINETKYIIIKLSGLYVKTIAYTVTTGEFKFEFEDDSFVLKFYSDLSPRMLKAFQHIAYLNKEKRKKSKF